MEDKPLLLDRFHELESQIAEIRNQLEPPKKSTLDRYLIKPCKTALANWTLVAFITGLIIAIGVYWRYDISYFESQKNIALTKESADAYRKLGDSLMMYGELDAARDAYNTALKMNSNNIDATRGLLATQVMQPSEGQKFIIPEIAKRKIENLKELIERDERAGVKGRLGLLKTDMDKQQGYIIDYLEAQFFQLKGEASQSAGDFAQAREAYDKAWTAFQESTRKNDRFIAGYVALATIDYENQDFDGAIEFLKKAKNVDPEFADVLNDLGACYLVKRQFAEAKKNFETSNQISPAFVTLINLAEANRYMGQPDKAIANDEWALEFVRNDENEKERVVGGPLLSSFMPEKPDTPPPQFNQRIDDLADKRTLVHYALSLDYAMSQDFTRADEAFQTARKLDSSNAFAAYVANRIVSLEHFSGLDLHPTVSAWLEKARKPLVETLWMPSK